MIPKIINLDVGNENIVVFSDTHLSNHLDSDQYEFIVGAIRSADRVVINGDFWDYGETTFDEFVNSAWKQLFPLLKKKKTVYLYGNHDLQRVTDNRVNLFSVKQGDHCLLKIKDYQLVIRHGCYLAPSNDIKFPQLFSNRAMLKFGDLLNLIGVQVARDLYLRMFFTRNRKMKKLSRQLNSNEILVCGHSHLAEKNLSQKYINTGVIRWGLGQYLLIEKGKLQLIKRHY